MSKRTETLDDSEARSSKRPKLDDDNTQNAMAGEAASTGLTVPPSETQGPSSPLDTRTDRPTKSDRGGRSGRGGRGGRGKGPKGGKGRQEKHGADGKGWRDGRSTGNDVPAVAASSQVDAKDGEAKEARRPKRKVALMLGYRGTDYHGLQVNPGVKTIEGAVFDALVQVGCVSQENSINPNKVGLARTARTDAGVHAAINVLVLKLILNPPSLPEGKSLIDHINDALPPVIRIWNIVRVQGAFNPRRLCDARTYLYYLPTYMLLPPMPDTPMSIMLESLGADAPERPNDDAGVAFWTDKAAMKEGDEAVDEHLVKAKRAWRVDAATLERTRRIASEFVGSHNYHNYSPAATFKDRSSQRIMKTIKVGDPVVVGEIEWIAVEILGQSFMLHQIRKMVGLLILAARTHAPPSLVPETFGPSRVHTPMAPSLGLLLDRPHFEQYNRKVVENNEALASKAADDETMKDPLEYGPELLAQVDEFKRTTILERMWADEAETNTFAKWIAPIDNKITNDFRYLNRKGVVPQTAISSQPDAEEVEARQAMQGVKAEELEG